MKRKVFVLIMVLAVLVSGCGGTLEETTTETQKPIEITEEVTEGEVIEEEPESVKEETEEQPQLQFEVTVGKTYYCYDENFNSHLFANITTNEDASAVSFMGFGYTDEAWDESLFVYDYLIQIAPGSSEYNSNDFYMNLGETSFELSSDVNRFGGTFTLLEEEPSFDLYNGAPTLSDPEDLAVNHEVEEEEVIEDDIIELTPEETPDFFRDTNNVGKRFSCLMIYNRAGQMEVGDEYVPAHILFFKDVQGRSFMAQATGLEDAIFYDGEIVKITGIYVGPSSDMFYNFVFNLESMELSEQ